MIPVTLTYRTWYGRTVTKRRDLPASFQEVEQSRRLPLHRALCSAPGEAGRVFGLRYLLNLPARTFRRLSENHIAALLEAVPWMQVQIGVQQPFPSFVHQGTEYFMPSNNGMNLVALEYPIADKSFQDYVANGRKPDLLLLCATLCREKHSNEAEALRRGDNRVPLLSRAEASARAKRLEDVDDAVLVGVLYFFAGIKQFVNQSYGPSLFEKKEGEDEASEPSSGPSLGWWSIYFSVAMEGPFGNLDAVHQTRFHDICLFLIDSIRKQKEAEMRARLASADFGVSRTGLD